MKIVQYLAVICLFCAAVGCGQKGANQAKVPVQKKGSPKDAEKLKKKATAVCGYDAAFEAVKRARKGQANTPAAELKPQQVLMGQDPFAPRGNGGAETLISVLLLEKEIKAAFISVNFQSCQVLDYYEVELEGTPRAKKCDYEKFFAYFLAGNHSELHTGVVTRGASPVVSVGVTSKSPSSPKPVTVPITAEIQAGLKELGGYFVSKDSKTPYFHFLKVDSERCQYVGSHTILLRTIEQLKKEAPLLPEGQLAQPPTKPQNPPPEEVEETNGHGGEPF